MKYTLLLVCGPFKLRGACACVPGKVWNVGIFHWRVVFIPPHRKLSPAGPHSCLKNADCFLLSLAPGHEA